MIVEKYSKVGLLILASAIICTTLVIALPSAPVQAALPPRPETPAAQPSKSNPDKVAGAHIELQIRSASAGLWTVVQWQDSAGDWHTVEGWQGTLDEGDKKIWQVAAADFGKGPFRWTVYQGKGGQLLGASASFHLPHAADEAVRVEVSLEQ